MTDTPEPQSPATEALLLQGLEACFATSGGNTQTPGRIFDFLRVAYLPAIEREAAETALRALRAKFEAQYPDDGSPRSTVSNQSRVHRRIALGIVDAAILGEPSDG